MNNEAIKKKRFKVHILKPCFSWAHFKSNIYFRNSGRLDIMCLIHAFTFNIIFFERNGFKHKNANETHLINYKNKKNYQIPKCKECWHINFSKNRKECIFIDKNLCPNPTIGLKKQEIVDYENNTCKVFKSTESMKGVNLGWRTAKKEIEKSNKKWFKKGLYYGTS